MAKVVLAFGSFDILHPGHLLYLEKAKRLGDKLVVVIARDESIKMFKGKAPFFNQADRARMIGSLKIVDKAVVGNKLKKPSDRYNIIKKYRPSIIVFGYDQKVNVPHLEEWLVANKLGAKIVRIKAKEDPRKYKSSKVKF
ncbi:MAG: FAD synthase [Candidatus Micrarchaeota archaeon]|nr:FAD synthase [Candidatus Micrarchaeota archaeon]